ncbi:hypothetical protein [Vallitalea guaymasensis]|uniref:hypothetical protein n=1 Tax=Vallitalea guaymasensis TaxID=1185412 RepID=UPI00187D6042|nr:hypothetical protein [Vallitalea guaymasensis]
MNLRNEKKSLNDFIRKKKRFIYGVAKDNTSYNKAGRATISKKDSWFYEGEQENIRED